MNIKPPLQETLDKYGLSLADWWKMAKDQDNKCQICKKTPGTGRFNIDHKHVSRWKHKPPEERKKWVRALLCWTCNRLVVGRGVTIEKLASAQLYLEVFNAKIKCSTPS